MNMSIKYYIAMNMRYILFCCIFLTLTKLGLNKVINFYYRNLSISRKNLEYSIVGILREVMGMRCGGGRTEMQMQSERRG